MEDKVKKEFDGISELYDGQRRNLIPCYDDFYRIATLFAAAGTDRPKILDLGAGTGLFSSFILNKFPKAELTLLDISDKMLGVARRRFSGLKNIDYVVSDYVESGIDGEYDLIISSLSIHHLEDKNKMRLFKDIYDSLNPGALFVNADQCLPESEEYAGIFDDYWSGYVESSGFTSEEIEGFHQRRKLDKEVKLTDQISWIRNAGFEIVECIYKYIQFCVIVARK